MRLSWRFDEAGAGRCAFALLYIGSGRIYLMSIERGSTGIHWPDMRGRTCPKKADPWSSALNDDIVVEHYGLPHLRVSSVSLSWHNVPHLRVSLIPLSWSSNSSSALGTYSVVHDEATA